MTDEPSLPNTAPAPSGAPPNRGAAWTIDEEQRLYDGFDTVADIAELAMRHGRDPGGIRSRLRHLGLLDPDGHVVIPKPPFTPSRMSLHRAARSRPAERATAMALADAGDGAALFLALLARLGPARRAIAMEVLRGLAACEAADARVAAPGAANRDEIGAPEPEKPAVAPRRDQP